MSTPEKPSKAPNNQKQKILIAALVVILLVVGWQLFGSGGGGSAPAPTINPGAANGPKPMTGGPQMSASNGMPAAMAPVALAPEMSQPKQASLPVNNEILRLQQQTQADYLQSVNKLQMLKIQQSIDETKTAIATAELSRMTAEKSIADLITSKESSGGGGDMGPIGGSPSSPYGNPPPFVSNTAPTVATVTTTTTPSAMVPSVPQMPVTPYTVLSVAYNGHRWTAVLAAMNKTMNVRIGDTLEDGSMVTSISRNEVTLRRDNKSRSIAVAGNI
jgi:hypothetical protein